jgi:hypothetical protein
MKLTKGEIEFLAAWAREESQPECYQLPAHRLQLVHGVVGAHLILFIKAWTQAEHKKDQDIIGAAEIAEPIWPWSTMEEFKNRFEEISRRQVQREVPVV